MAGYIIYSLDWDKFQQLVQRPTPDQLIVLGQALRDELDQLGELTADEPLAAWPKEPKALAEVTAKRLSLPDWYGDLSATGKTVWEAAIFRACMNDDGLDVGFRVDSDGVYWDVIELAWKQLGVVPNAISDVALSAFGTRPYRCYQPQSNPRTGRADFDKAADERRASLDALRNILGNFVESARNGQADPSTLLDQLENDPAVSQMDKELIMDLLSENEDGFDDDDSEQADWTPMHSMHAPDEVQKMLAELKSVEPALKKSKNQDAWRDYQELIPALDAIASDGRMLFVQVDT